MNNEITIKLNEDKDIVIKNFKLTTISIGCDDSKPLKGRRGKIVDWRITNPYRLFLIEVPVSNPMNFKLLCNDPEKGQKCIMSYQGEKYINGRLLDTEWGDFGNILNLKIKFPIPALGYFKEAGILDYVKKQRRLL